MTRRSWLLIAPAASLLAAAAVSRVPRGALGSIETHFNRRLETFDVSDPLFIIGGTRGIYIEGYGAVFTNEVGLVPTPNITPFRPAISKEDIARLRQRKLDRLPAFRRTMRDMLVHGGNSLHTVPLNEQIVLATIFYYAPWEDRTGLPSEIRYHATRQALVDIEKGRADDGVIKVQEF
jgi:hypothetical protein